MTTTGMVSLRRELLTSDALSRIWMISSAAAWYPAARKLVARANCRADGASDSTLGPNDTPTIRISTSPVKSCAQRAHPRDAWISNLHRAGQHRQPARSRECTNRSMAAGSITVCGHGVRGRKLLAPRGLIVATLTLASSNQIGSWLRQIDRLRHAA